MRAPRTRRRAEPMWPSHCRRQLQNSLEIHADHCEKPVLDSQEPMILKQYYLGCLAHASYLLGDEESGTAVVVDPQRDIQLYVSDAEKFGVRIRHVFLS